MIPATPVVHIVDDDASFLTAAARLLRATGYAVKTFDSAPALLAQLSPETPGCVVADLRMPGLNGLDLQAALTASGVMLPIIFLTGHGSISSSVKAMRHGAEDFLEKRAPKEQLLDAVNRALARNARERVEKDRLQRVRQVFASLTARETEVLAHVLRGRLNKQIAADLGINERSVKRHRTAITTKLQVRSVAELARLAQEAGLVSANTTHRP